MNMALIKCPECGREISDKALTCPNCGFPINTGNNYNYSPRENIPRPFITATVHCPPTCTQKIGPVQIDENNKMFRILGSVPVNGKRDGIGKSLFNNIIYNKYNWKKHPKKKHGTKYHISVDLKSIIFSKVYISAYI